MASGYVYNLIAMVQTARSINHVTGVEVFPTAKSSKKPLMAIAAILFVAFLALTWKNENFYLWIKALHIIAVISWMAGMAWRSTERSAA